MMMDAKNELVYIYVSLLLLFLHIQLFKFLSSTSPLKKSVKKFPDFLLGFTSLISFWHAFDFVEGTLMTASAHIITAVIGSGVLSLSWALAQLGWIAGIIALLIFSLITLLTCILLTDCYRSPDPITGRRNYNYMEAVKNNLGKTIADFLSVVNNYFMRLIYAFFFLTSRASQNCVIWERK